MIHGINYEKSATMKLISPVILLLFMACSPQINLQKSNRKNNFIDPFMCTSGEHGHTDPAAAVPFGMVKPAPDSDPLGYSGYDFSAQTILGFSNTRFSGVGCQGVGGNIRILPFVLTDGNQKISKSLKLDKKTEIASVGYYSVVLENKVQAELTATRQVAFHRYTFPKSEHVGLVIDLASSFVGNNYEEHQIDTSGVIFGKISSRNICNKGDYTIYFALSIDKEEVKITSNESKIEIKFSSLKNQEVLVRCALSVVSVENAKNNLNVQSSVSFTSVRKNAVNDWEKILQTVDIETSDSILKRKFYTHLYHVVQTPFIIQDQGGEYRGSDGELYKTKQKNHFYGWSIWDTFRTKLPLFSLLYREHYIDMMTSLGELYKQGKVDWSTPTEPFLTVRTEHSITVLLDALEKNLLNYSLENIYPKLQEEIKNLSFETPDKILESSYDLWAMSKIAEKLGYVEDSKTYIDKAYEYEKVWDEKFKIMGKDADLMEGAGLYQGTLWQYRWFVPFDIRGIQEKLGGKHIFEKQLDYFFANNLFNVGNQPDIQVPFLYLYTDSPWKTQKLVHQILTEPTINRYGSKIFKEPIIREVFLDTPEGYITDMDDDAGTMSGWYIFASMGIYPVCPGEPFYAICSPLFKKVTIHIDTKNTFVIQADDVSDINIYIQSAMLNGKPLNRAWIRHNEILSGGKLIFKMGAIPNKKWGLKDPL